MTTIQKISVLGGGAWGTALAQTCARAGRAVTLWEYDAANAEQLADKRESRFLPGVRLEDAITVTRELNAAVKADAILLVVPAQAMRSVVTALASLATVPKGGIVNGKRLSVTTAVPSMSMLFGDL